MVKMVYYNPEARTTPIDTPFTDLTWERFAFSGNSLKLDFRRLLSDSLATRIRRY